VFEKQSMYAEIDIYNSRFDFVRSVHPMDQFILTYGIIQESNLKKSFIKFMKLGDLVKNIGNEEPSKLEHSRA